MATITLFKAARYKNESGNDCIASTTYDSLPNIAQCRYEIGKVTCAPSKSMLFLYEEYWRAKKYARLFFDGLVLKCETDGEARPYMGRICSPSMLKHGGFQAFWNDIEFINRPDRPHNPSDIYPPD